jgi:hypothetical protein
MTDQLVRVSSYGQPVFQGLTGPLWRHACGHLTSVDLLADGDAQLQPWQRPCEGCGVRDGWIPYGNCDGWLPLLTYTGPLCDQCQGNGWVPIAGKVNSAPYGFVTVTECTACEASGMDTR